jgi:hypothetical protein
MTSTARDYRYRQPEEVEILKALLVEGLTYPEIGERLGRSGASIGAMVYRLKAEGGRAAGGASEGGEPGQAEGEDREGRRRGGHHGGHRGRGADPGERLADRDLGHRRDAGRVARWRLVTGRSAALASRRCSVAPIAAVRRTHRIAGTITFAVC